jgi:phytoene desaturase
MYRLDPQYRLVFGSGGELLATPDLERMERAIGLLSPEDARGFHRFFCDNRNKLEKFLPFLESPFESWRDLAKLDMLKMLPLLRPWRSLDSDLRSYFKDDRIRLGFSFQSKYLGMSPFTCPSLFSILSFLEYEHGVFHPVGGCGAVTRAMARIAEDLGAKVLLNEPVEEMVFSGRKCTAVRTASRTLAADAVVVNADFAQAMQRMVPNSIRRRWTDTRIAKKRFSCSTFMLYLGVEGLYDDVSHHTIYLASDYKQNLRDIEELHRLSDDPSFYVQNACVTDPSLAPRKMSTLYVLLPVTHEHKNIHWAAEKGRFRSLALRQLEKIGIADVERRIQFEKMVTPADWRTDYALHKGATFSMAHNLGQMLHLRPHNRFEDLDSVYLVGGGTHPGSGLPVIFESARITARLLLEDLRIEPQWDTASPLGETAMYEAAS